MNENVRLVIEVMAGVLPDIPEDEFTRRYVLTEAEWSKAVELDRATELLAEVVGRAQGYATLLMMQPARVNWVKVDWLWL